MSTEAIRAFLRSATGAALARAHRHAAEVESLERDIRIARQSLDAAMADVVTLEALATLVDPAPAAPYVPSYNADVAPETVRFADGHTDESLTVRSRDGGTVSAQDAEGRIVLASDGALVPDLRGLAAHESVPLAYVPQRLDVVRVSSPLCHEGEWTVREVLAGGVAVLARTSSPSVISRPAEALELVRRGT